MIQTNRVTAAKQVEQLHLQLAQAFCTKADAEAAVKQADEKIVAIRNLLAGIPIGQQLQTELTPSPTVITD